MARMRTAGTVVLIVGLSLAAAGCMIPSGTYDCTYTFVRPSQAPIDVATVVTINANSVAEAEAAVRREADRVRSLQSQYQGAQVIITCRKREEEPKKVEAGPTTTGTYSGRRNGVKFTYLQQLRGGGRSVAPMLRLDQAQAAQSDQLFNSASFTTSFVIEVDLVKDEFSFAPMFAGGLRFERPISPRLNGFGQVTAGLVHYPEANAFILKPSAGIVMPLTGKPFSIVAAVGFPFMRSFGDFETGFELSGGVAFNLGR